MSRTSISWVARPGTLPETWNPTIGCDKQSEGCRNCYALRRAARNRLLGLAAYQNEGSTVVGKFGPMSGPGFKLTVLPDRLDIPRRWKKPRTVFVDSMSDLFHDDVPLEFIQQVFQVMVDCPQHTFLILTKRATRLARIASQLPWPPNVWMGVSVEDQSQVERRARRLLQVPAAVRWLSVEPQLEEIDLDTVLWTDELPWGPDGACGGRKVATDGIAWVVAGGESGPDCRPAELAWFGSLRDQCDAAGVRFFMKQLGERWARAVGAQNRKGEDIAEWPVSLQVREWPETARGGMAA